MNPQHPFDMRSKTALITGGSGVLCGEIAAALAAQGANVVLLAHTHPEQAQQQADRICRDGGKATVCTGDVTDKESLRRVHERIQSQFGPLDLLVNGAGGAHPAATTSPTLSFFDLPEPAVRQVFDLNFLGTFFACQEFLGDMVSAGRGAVLNVASMGAIRPLTRSVAYSAAKAAVVNFTQWLAVHVSQEYGPGVRVNALVPGFFLTEQNRFLLIDAETEEFTERGRRIVEHTPLGRLGVADDLIGAALFLLSDAAAFIHGSTLAVDGGLNAYGGV